MSDIFASSSLVEIEVNYTVSKGRGAPIITMLSDEEAAKKKADPKEKDSVRTLRTSWKPQSWKSANELLAKAQSYNHELREMEIDPYKHRNARLLTLLVEWDGIDVKDAQGVTITCTVENINKLHVNLAIALLAKYDQIGLPDRSEVEKKMIQLRDILDGKGVAKIDDDIYLVMFVTVTGWSLERVENMSRKQFMEMAPLIEMVFRRQYQPIRL